MKRLLFIAHRVPYPPDKGERVRAFNEVRLLSEHFEVTVAALAHGPDDFAAAAELKRWCGQVIVARGGGKAGLLRGAAALLAGRSVTEGFFSVRPLVRELARQGQPQPFDLVVGYSSPMLDAVLGVPARVRVIDLVDADSAKWASYAESSRWPKSWLCRREGRRVAELERRAVARCDAVILVSREEARALAVESPKVHAIGNGVDTEYFAPRPGGDDDRPSLVFTGTMSYRPNVEGVCWFAREVWPGLKREVPELTFTIAGRDPARQVRRLARREGIVVTGRVPDVRGYLAAAAVAVVPLRMARGLQNKVLEAMAMGLPVVASGAALEGLEVQRDDEVIEADLPGQWHERILGLLRNNDLRRRLGRSARRCVEEKYNWARRLGPLVSLCERLLEAEPAQ